MLWPVLTSLLSPAAAAAMIGGPLSCKGGPWFGSWGLHWALLQALRNEQQTNKPLPASARPLLLLPKQATLQVTAHYCCSAFTHQVPWRRR
jgi:hypothetical protein